MRVHRIKLLAFLVLCSVPLVGHGQDERPQFRAGVELIQLDVVVLDGKRQPVRGLGPADFTVLDNGVETSIRAFTPVELAARTAASDAVWASDVAPDVVSNNIGEQEGRLVVILMDRSIPAHEPTVSARKIATAAVAGLGPNDLAAVVSTANGAVQNGAVQNLTADRARLLRAINYGDPATSWSPDAEVIMGKADPLTDGRCLCGICVLETITRIADAVRDMPRRRKVLFFIGSDMVWQATGSVMGAGANTGCETPIKDARAVMFAAVDRASLTIHSVDPQGLVSLGPQTQGGARGGFDRPVDSGPTQRLRQQQMATVGSISGRQNLQVLPDRTGGRTVVGRNNPDLTIAEIYHESDAYYLLGIERAASASPDGTRSIEVKVGRKGLHAYAQRKYVVPSATAHGASSTSAQDALNALLPNARVPLSLAVTPFASPESNKPMLRVSVDAGAFAHTDGTAAPLEISVLAVDRTGKQVAAARQTSTITAPRSSSGVAPEVTVQSHLELGPGDYGIRVAVSDASAGTVASVFSDVTVPQFGDAPVSLSGVSVEIARGSADPRAAAPTTRRVFTRAEQVRVVTQIYQGTERTDAIAPVSLRVQILDAKGTTVRDQSLPFAATAFTNRRADCVITLPLASLNHGEYLLKLEAASNRQTSGRALRFAVE